MYQPGPEPEDDEAVEPSLVEGVTLLRQMPAERHGVLRLGEEVPDVLLVARLPTLVRFVVSVKGRMPPNRTESFVEVELLSDDAYVALRPRIRLTPPAAEGSGKWRSWRENIPVVVAVDDGCRDLSVLVTVDGVPGPSIDLTVAIRAAVA